MLRILLLLSLGLAVRVAAEEVVNVYSHRHYDADRQLFERFEATTGIKVNVVKANADELLHRLEVEGAKSPADVLITVDAGRLWRAREKGLLQPAKSALLDKQVPAHLRDPDGHWFGLTQRARVVVYSRDRVDPAALTTYEALADKAWRKRIAIRSSQNIYNQSLLASLVAHHGEEAAAQWAEGMVKNFARSPRGNDRDQIKAVAAGQADLAVVNTYYLGLLLHSDSAAEREIAQAVGIFFPNQEGRGAHMNVSGVGVVRHAKHREQAIRLIEFLTSPEAQTVFASANYEYPVHPEVPWSPQLKAWGTFKADKLPVVELGSENDKAVRIFDRVGWR